MTTNEARNDPNDQLYLHPSDHPGLQLVAQPFDGRNFGEWRRLMKIALSAKNKIGFIDGTLEKPETGSSLCNRWERCNDMVTSWLINGLSAEIRSSVIYIETAKGIWKELESRFAQLSGAQFYSARRDFNNASQGTSPISTYFNKWKSLLAELTSLRRPPACRCDARTEILKYEEEQHLVSFLMGLNESYTAARGTILMMKPLPSVAVAYSMLEQEETQREMPSNSQSQVESAAMSVTAKGNHNYNSGGYAKGNQGNQNNRGNSGTGYSPKGGQGSQNNQQRKPLFCTNCKKTNHTIDRCYFIIGFPPNRNANDKKSGEKFAGTVSQGSADLTSDQISKLLSLLNSKGLANKDVVQDDFAGFAGSFYEDANCDW